MRSDNNKNLSMLKLLPLLLRSLMQRQYVYWSHSHLQKLSVHATPRILMSATLAIETKKNPGGHRNQITV